MNAFRTAIAAAAIVSASSSIAFAQAAPSGPWVNILGQGGVKVVSSSARGDRTSYTLESSAGRFTLDAAGTVKPEAARALLSLGQALSGWKSLTAGSIAFTALGDDVRVRVVPSKFAEESRDFLPYVPSGLVFSSVGAFIDYEFRVKVDAYFLRFRGRFDGERALLDRLAAAIDDPAAFVRDNDPEYHLARTIEQEEVLIAHKDQMAAGESKIAANESRIAAHQDLIAALEARIAALEARLSAREKVLIANQAKTAAKPVNPAIIERIVALSAENPNMASKDMVLKLKSEGIVATIKQVDAVRIVLFGK